MARPESTKPIHWSETRVIPEALQTQLGTFLDARKQILRKRVDSKDLSDSELDQRQQYLSRFSKIFLAERIGRAGEIGGDNVKEAVKIFEKWLPYKTFGVVCYDGRLGAAVIFGIPGGYGGFLRTKGGDLSHFDVGVDGKLVLDPNSNIGSLIREAEERNPGIPKCQVLDSHIGCAARGYIEERRGKQHKFDDGGLREDVKRKKQLAEAISEAGPLAIQFTSNPEKGYGFMGLEKDDALEVARERRGYTADVLEELAMRKVIISTATIAEDYRELFEQNRFKIDWESEYGTSSFEFAKRLDEILETDIYFNISELVKNVFGESISEEEIQQRTVLLIANAFNGYLQNADVRGYPHHTHEEQCEVVLEAGFGPYKITKELPVVPGDNFLGDADFGQHRIIRANRESRKIRDFTETYAPDEFVEAPVPIFLFGIVKGTDMTEITEQDWNSVINFDWSDLNTDDPRRTPWYELPDELFEFWLENKGVTHETLKRTMTILRNRYVAMCRRGDVSRFVADGSIEVIPVLVNQDRRPISIPNMIFEGVRATEEFA